MPPPRLRAVHANDLKDTARLLALHEQAVAKGVFKGGEAARLDFLCYAHRARSQGHDPVRLFVWLIRHDKREFITYADEEDAQGRLRQFYNSSSTLPTKPKPVQATTLNIVETPRDLGADERAVELYLRLTKGNTLAASAAVQKLRGWTQEQWDTAYASYTTKQAQQWI